MSRGPSGRRFLIGALAATLAVPVFIGTASTLALIAIVVTAAIAAAVVAALTPETKSVQPAPRGDTEHPAVGG